MESRMKTIMSSDLKQQQDRRVDPNMLRQRICCLRQSYTESLLDAQCTIRVAKKSKTRSGSAASRCNSRTIKLNMKNLEYHTRFWTCISFIYNNPLKYESAITLRELYYNLPIIFKTARQIYKIIQDICYVLEVQRHELFVEGSPRGQVLGHLMLKQANGAMIDCENQAQLITSAMVEDRLEIRSSAHMIVLVEKEAILSRFAAHKLHDRLGAILLTGKGMPSLLTKRFAKKLQVALNLPIYGLFDYNPFGASIFLDYKIGSSNYITPGGYGCEVEWIGLFWEDILKLGISDGSFKEFTRRDLSVAKGLLEVPYIQGIPHYLRTVETMVEYKVKIELEALNEVEFDFIARFLQTRIMSMHSSQMLNG